ncbi:MAG: hypothetical protein AAGC84_11635 [Pseudomonas sp.]
MQIKTLAGALALALASQLAHAQVFFDTRFASPPNIAGQPIVIDGTAATPSRVNMGSIDMNVGFAGQAGNWAIFNAPSCGYDQIEFMLPAGLTHATVEWDMLASKLTNSQSAFSVHLDSSDYGARSITMHGGSNNIGLSNKGGAYASLALEDQRKYHVSARIDVATDMLEIDINNTKYYKGSFGSSNLSGVRFNLSPWIGGATACNDATAALSNVRIYENPIDLETPPPVPAKVGLVFTSTGAAVQNIPPTGGTLYFKRTITNLDVQQLSLLTWISTTLADGTGYTLGAQHTASVPPGGNVSLVYSSLPIPRWLPAGQYKARLSVVNQVTNEITFRDISFNKLP